MVAPGSLSFAIIRGIQFDEYILQCRDEKVTVESGGLPQLEGLYLPTGQFGGYDMFVLAAAPSWFLYFNAGAASYLIAQELTTGGVTNYLLPASPLVEPTGIYVGHGTYTGQSATVSDNPTDLTGFEAEALVRRSSNPLAEVVLDLQPAVTSVVNGEITIPQISKADTEDLRLGNFFWDLVLKETATGERFGPFAAGAFIISDNITSSLAPAP